MPDARLRGRVDITKPPATAMGLIEIDEPLQEVQEDLYANGLTLSKLLRRDYPDVGAIEEAINDIKLALTFGDKVCQQRVTSHVVQNSKKMYLVNIHVCQVRFVYTYFEFIYALALNKCVVI